MHTYIAILALLAPLMCWGDSLSGRVVGVTDGDTVTLLTVKNEQVKVRLSGIDAPEKAQAFGAASKKALSDICFGKPATVESHGKDKYGRTIGDLMCDGLNANKQQVMDGMAWVYRQYSNDEHLIALEGEAKANSRGLWSDASPVPPWDFRHGGKPKAVNVAQASDEPAAKSKSGFACAGKTKCGEMDSCEEARFYLKKCGVSRLDRDRDGIPCETLCGN